MVRPSPPGPPPTLRYLAEKAVGIDAECRDCRHRVVLGFEKFFGRYGDMLFPHFAQLMKCSACGSRHVDVRRRGHRGNRKMPLVKAIIRSLQGAVKPAYI